MDNLRERLDQHYQWPADYTFKFVIPVDLRRQLEFLFEGEELQWRASRSAKYLSMTLVKSMPSSAAVLAIYERVHGQIPEAIAL